MVIFDSNDYQIVFFLHNFTAPGMGWWGVVDRLTAESRLHSDEYAGGKYSDVVGYSASQDILGLM